MCTIHGLLPSTRKRRIKTGADLANRADLPEDLDTSDAHVRTRALQVHSADALS